MTRPRRKRPRNRPVVLDPATRRILDLAKEAESGNAERLEFKRELLNNEGQREAKKVAEDSCEVRLTNLPRYEDLNYLVDAIDWAIAEAWYFHPCDRDDCRFVQRIQSWRESTSACAIIAPDAVAHHIINLGEIFVDDRTVPVSLSSQALAGIGAPWKTRREPGAVDIPIRDLELGQLDHNAQGKPVFHYLWRSNTSELEDPADTEGEYNDEENYYYTPPSVAVQMVSQRICITLNEHVEVLAGEYRSGEFSRTMSPLRIEIPFLSILHAATYHKADPKDPCNAVLIQLRHPPMLFREAFAAKPDTVWATTNHASATGEVEETKYVRTIDFTENHAFARCRAVRIFLNAKDNSFRDFFNILMRAKIIRQTIRHPFQNIVPSRLVTLETLCVRKAMVHASTELHIPFAVRYEVACLLASGAVTEDEIADEKFWGLIQPLEQVEALRVFDILQKKSAAAKDLRVDLRKELFYVIETVKSHPTRRISDVEEHDSEVDEKSESKSGVSSSSGKRSAARSAREEPATFTEPGVNAATQAILRDVQDTSDEPESKFVPIRRLMVTPTRVVPCRPELDMLNRILRQYYPFRERFIRVSFVDEDSDNISHCDSGDLYAQVRKWLRDGIEVAGEKFVFLAFSSSQLRENGCWFYNEASGRDGKRQAPTADQIRHGFGDLSDIKAPSRYAARMGQVFSATIRTLSMDRSDFEVAKDILSDDKKYQFSDGVGMMSQELADRIKEKLQIKGDRTPSAFQVRFAGAKGVLSVWPKMEKKMIFRKSMIKFRSAHKVLEVVGFSKKLPFFLNRQVIMILECLGVPKSTFIEMQVDYLKEIDSCIEANNNETSMQLLKRMGWGGGRSERDHKFCNVGSMVNPMLLFRAGLNCTNCEFLHEVMYNYRRKVISNVRNRASIPVQKALNGIGILDELGVLNAGEIYCRYSDPNTDKVVAVVGEVIVGRQPCMHPGDLQKVTAVDHPELRHLVDVVVFSQKGDRPLPNMLSGGDLDGDLYFIIWDERLVRNTEMHKPMKYGGGVESVKDGHVTMDDVQKFMVEYMADNNLGKIANTHMVYADKYGINSSKARHLALLAGTAVDFAKTGRMASISPELRVKSEAKAFPDFMGRHSRVSYKSEKALGFMYRNAMGGDWRLETPKFDPAGATEVNRFFDDYGQIDPDVMDEAWALCESWNSQVRDFMTQYGVETEAEVVTGQVVNFSTHCDQPSVKRKHAEQLAAMNRYMKQLRKTFLEAFYEDAHAGDDDSVPDLTRKHVRKMVAWYRTARMVADVDRKAGKTPMHSFPFVVSNVLIQFVAHWTNKLRETSESSVNADSEDADLDGSENSHGQHR